MSRMPQKCSHGKQNSCVLNDQKLSEDNQKLRSGCPPDYQIFLGNILKIVVHTNSLRFLFSPIPFPTNISFWELKTNRILYGIKMRATKNMSRTIRFPILVVLRLPTFDSNFATLLSCLYLTGIPILGVYLFFLKEMGLDQLGHQCPC